MITEIFNEWVQREHPLTSGEHRERLRRSFMTGAWSALGLASRISKQKESKSKELYDQLRKELRDQLGLPAEVPGLPRVRASINGEGI